jgi:hypothetical protein
MILALVALGVGILGAGAVYRSHGVPGQIQFLFHAVAGLSERSEENEEDIGLIVAHIRLMKESLCEIHEAEAPGFCDTDCVEGICDTTGEGDACEGPNPPANCDLPDDDCPGC